MKVECGQEWLDIDGELHRCIKPRRHADGYHQDRAGFVWSQRWVEIGSDLYSPTREPGADDG